jgi:hypothetical protein
MNQTYHQSLFARAAPAAVTLATQVSDLLTLVGFAHFSSLTS